MLSHDERAQHHILQVRGLRVLVAHWSHQRPTAGQDPSAMPAADPVKAPTLQLPKSGNGWGLANWNTRGTPSMHQSNLSSFGNMALGGNSDTMMHSVEDVDEVGTKNNQK